MNDNYVHETVKTVIKSLYWDGLSQIIKNTADYETMQELIKDYEKTFDHIINIL